MRPMKDSGVEWIGEIPEGWSTGRVKSLFREVNERSNNDDDYQLLSVSEYYGIAPKADKVEEGDFLTHAETLDGYKICKPDDIVMNIMLAWKRAIGMSRYDGIVSPAYCVYRKISEEVFPEYFHYLFRTDLYANVFKQFSTGIIDSRLRLYPDKFLSLSCHVPPIKEQRRIADYLDRKCAAIDSVIEKQQKIIGKLKEYKLSIITEAVTKGLNPDAEMKDSGVEWLGNIPSAWKVYRIANLYDETSENGSDELPILTVSINSGISDRELSDEESDRVFVRSEDKTKYKRVIPGDLAYNMMRAWQGAFGAARVEGMVSPAYVTCRPKPNVGIDTRYIEYLFRTHIATEEMHRHSHGIADFRLRLYWPEFKNIRLCVPSLEEQKTIADYIDEKTGKIEKTIDEREKAISKLQEYKKSLIYEVVTGKKEVKDWKFQ